MYILIQIDYQLFIHQLLLIILSIVVNYSYMFYMCTSKYVWYCVKEKYVTKKVWIIARVFPTWPW